MTYLLERFDEFWRKILKYPWGFYFKTLTRNTNETRLRLELGKLFDLAPPLVVAVS